MAFLRALFSLLALVGSMFGLVFRFIERLVCVVILITALVGCRSVEKTIAPSNFRDWAPEQAVLPTAEIRGNQVTIHNVRNCQYFAKDVYLVGYYDKTFDLDRVRSVDFISVPFAMMPWLAHTMISFEITGPAGQPEHLALSIETRKERDEKYTAWKGSARQYELMYIFADERDVIQQRTNFRGEDVYLYRTTATPEAAQSLLVDAIGRANQLAEHPEFYDTLTNNCTSNLVRHVNRIKPNRISADPRALLPGYADELAYADGLIEHNGTFLETKRQAYINPLAVQSADREDFSELIRRR